MAAAQHASLARMASIGLSLTLGLVASCINLGAYQCQDEGDCNLEAGGVCDPAGFCAYPDPGCDSGFVFKGAGSRDGECTEPSTGDTAGDGSETDTSSDTGESETGESPDMGPQLDMPIEAGCGDGVVEPGEFCPDPDPQEIMVGFGPFWIDTVDFDGDEILDLLVTNQQIGQLAVLSGLGDGSFAVDQMNMGPEQPWQVTHGDLNGDGLVDIIVADRGGDRTQLYFQELGGSLAPPVDLDLGNNNSGVVVGDLDGDDNLDIVVVNNETPGSITAALGAGDGTFPIVKSYPADAETFGLDIGDLNGDELLDVAATNRDSNNVIVFLNNGMAGLDFEFLPQPAFTTGLQPSVPAADDLDGDGDTDLVIANLGSNNASIYENSGGTFSILDTFQTCTGPGAPTAADVDQDQDLDLLIPCIGGGVTVGFTDGDGLVTETLFIESPGLPASVAAGDFNGDGALDFATTDALLGTTVRIFVSDP